MQILRKILLLTTFLVLSLFAIFYFAFLFVLPKAAVSKTFNSKIQEFVYSKTKYNLEFDGFTLKTYPNLSAELELKNIRVDEFLRGVDVYVCIAPLRLKPCRVIVGDVFFDKTKFKPQKGTSNKKLNIDYKKIPDISLLNADILLEEGTNIQVKDLYLASQKDKKEAVFNAVISTKSLKDKIIIGNKGVLSFDNKGLYADNLEAAIGNAKLNINGKLFDKEKKYDFILKGDNLPVDILEANFLSFMKMKDKKKNFIENFYDFSGKADINLRFVNSSIFGNAVTKNLSAKTVKFNIPVTLPHTDFIFSDDKINALAKGKFGNEDVYTDLYITDLFSKEKRVVLGNVKADLSRKFTDKYTPEYRIRGKVPVHVQYHIKNRVVTVKYNADLPKNSNLYYKNIDLGLMQRDRRLYARTVKHGVNLFLKTYDYSFVDGGKVNNIILGNGLFVQKNGHLVLDYITCKTNGYAPVSVTGSFGRYVEGGIFNGNLKYSYAKNLLTGKFILKDSKYKSFYVEKAVVKATDENFGLAAKGTFENSPYICYADLVNSFEDKITVHDIHLYLKNYRIRRSLKTKAPAGANFKEKAEEFAQKTKDIEWFVENGSIIVDEIKYNNIVLNDIWLVGNLKNDIASVLMPATSFADGTLYAKGTYDIKEQNADVNFSALNINSNYAAGMLLNLKDQVEGQANAMMHLKTYDGLNKLDAHTEFFIENGALSKIGSTEFIIKKNKKIKKNLKFKLTDIINVDIDKMKALKSNLYGEFDVHNHKLYNAEIYSKHRYLSLFAEGNYDIKSEDANITVWGRYNRSAQKNIKILFVPLSWITNFILKPEYTKDMYMEKLNKIPPVEAKKNEEVDFTVRMKGNLNDNSSIKVELKEIK